MRPLHHGDGGAGEERNFLQRFNDSEGGNLLASVSHTAGALLFTAGMALYLYVAHSARRAHREGGQPQLGLLVYAHGFTLVGIGLNGVGGLMRLYQSDHPGLDQLGSSTWVQVLLIKHLFLLAGIGLALYVTWRTRRWGDPDAPKPALNRESRRIVGFALGSFLTILAATVLGAVAGNTDLAAEAGLADDMNPGDDHGDHLLGPALLEPSTATGTLTGVPVQPGLQPFEFPAPEGADRLVVELNWTHDVAKLEVTLKDPVGAVVEGRTETAATRFTRIVEGTIAAGTWHVEVRATQAVQEPFTLRFLPMRALGTGRLIEDTVTVEAGRFFEINLLQSSGDALSFAWELDNGTGPIYFDIHLHRDGQITYPVRGEWSAHEGNYTHDGSTQGPSLLWENNGSQPLRVHYRVWGEFDVDSYYPAAGAAANPWKP